MGWVSARQQSLVFAFDINVLRMSKYDLRFLLKLQRQQMLFDAVVFQKKQQKMAFFLEEFFERKAKKTARNLLGYVPLMGEVCFFDLYLKLFQRGWRIYLPCVVAKELPLVFLEYDSIEDDQLTPYQSLTRKDAMNLACPQGKAVDTQIHYALIPSLGVSFFQSKLYRLGYGGGFYDRTLVNYPCMVKIAVTPKQSCVDFFPEAHDVALDGWLNEDGLQLVNKFC